MSLNILKYEKFIRWTGIISSTLYILIINADEKFNVLKFISRSLMYISLLLMSFIWYREKEISKTRLIFSSLATLLILTLLFINLR